MIFIVSGPGGVGKGTIVKRLMELVPGLRLSRSWTTRPRRPSEAEDAYVFVDEASFKARAEAGGFLEWTRFDGNGHLYGTPRPDPDEERDLLLEIELDGAEQVMRTDPSAALIFVVAPSPAEQEGRLRARGDDEQSIRRRMDVGRQEQELGTRLAQHVVVNDDVDRAAREVAGIIAGRRQGSP